MITISKSQRVLNKIKFWAAKIAKVLNFISK